MGTEGGFFLKDDETSALGRKATALKDAKDWDGAIRCLREMKERMWVSPVNYGIDAWCRLALVLQQAGRFEESEREFEKLLEDVPKLARKIVYWNEPDVCFGKPGKLAMFNQRVKIDTEIIKERRELARKRERAKIARLAKAALGQSARKIKKSDDSF